MAKVTAVIMDVVTDKSGHTVTPMAVSVCTTPAAPAPLPLPYPVVASSIEGISDTPMRTKVDGTVFATVGSVLKTCHGNEPGTLKEVVSLNTSGPVFVAMGAPTVVAELGMIAITGSPCVSNKAPTPGAGGSATDASGSGSAGDGAGSDGAGDGSDKKADDQSGGGGSGNDGTSTGASHDGPTPEERALAAEENAHPDDGKNGARVAARKKVAADFSRKHGQKFDRNLPPPPGKVRPLTRDERKSELKCIDYDKPVVTGPPPPCQSPLSQWQAPGGKRGSYFAPKGTPPEALGIGSKGTAWSEPGQPTRDKVSTEHTIPPDEPWMKSTASPAVDDWSVKKNPDGSKNAQPAPGGGTQIQIPGGCDPDDTGIQP
jgi:hypothetical protein